MDWDGLTAMRFIGLDNYIEALQNPTFWNSFKNNLYVVVASVFGQVPIALALALLLNRRIKGAKFFRTTGFLPVIISTVIVSLTWSMVYNTEYGLLNRFLKAVGLGFLAQNWLGDPKWAMLSVCITIIWQFIGLYFIIFLAALQNVPQELYEAAELDGASEWVKTWKITIPMIKETLLVSVILCISGSLRTFDLIYVMTNGGPARATEVMAIYMFNETFSSTRYGYGSAVSALILVFSLMLIYVASKVFKTKTIQEKGERGAV
ncbi:sugar ABC transporter permease [Hydrogenibacillus sp. N12]|nr:sugar ABC transporter permease [Hydrogenibacillus sp. N12]